MLEFVESFWSIDFFDADSTNFIRPVDTEGNIGNSIPRRPIGVVERHFRQKLKLRSKKENLYSLCLL